MYSADSGAHLTCLWRKSNQRRLSFSSGWYGIKSRLHNICVASAIGSLYYLDAGSQTTGSNQQAQLNLTGVSKMAFAAVLLVLLLCIVVCHYIASKRGLNPVFWGVMGGLFGPFAILFVLIKKTKQSPDSSDIQSR